MESRWVPIGLRMRRYIFHGQECSLVYFVGMHTIGVSLLTRMFGTHFALNKAFLDTEHASSAVPASVNLAPGGSALNTNPACPSQAAVVAASDSHQQPETSFSKSTAAVNVHAVIPEIVTPATANHTEPATAQPTNTVHTQGSASSFETVTPRQVASIHAQAVADPAPRRPSTAPPQPSGMFSRPLTLLIRMILVW
jgi:hypothetical protein